MPRTHITQSNRLSGTADDDNSYHSSSDDEDYTRDRRRPGQGKVNGKHHDPRFLKPTESAAWMLHEAAAGNYLQVVPKYRRTFEAMKINLQAARESSVVVWALMLLSFFENPLWCDGSDRMLTKGSDERCLMPGKAPKDDVIMSGLPLVPIWPCIVFEVVCLLTVFMSAVRNRELKKSFAAEGLRYEPKRGNWGTTADMLLVALGIVDVAYFIVHPETPFRFAPYVRFGLCALHPHLERIIRSFFRVLRAVTKIGFFLLLSVLLFAWIAAMIFNDRDDSVADGFTSFGESLYTTFAATTTANMPDFMLPSYQSNRGFAILWLPLFIITCCILTQVILATVYSEYQDQMKSNVQNDFSNRSKGALGAFSYMKTKNRVSAARLSHTGRHHSLSQAEQNAKTGNTEALEESVKFPHFLELVRELTALGRVNIDKQVLQIVYSALDDDGNGFVSQYEFHDLLDVLSHQYLVTARDSMCYCKCVTPLCYNKNARQVVKRLGAQEPTQDGKDGCLMGYEVDFPGSPLDYTMNFLLALNVVWIVVESYYDLNDLVEPQFFNNVDTFFAFVYIFEVVAKLLVWSCEEYWSYVDNRFDFVTSIILSAGGFSYLFFSLTSDTLRYLNMLRLLRVLKALNNIPAYQMTCQTIARMTSSCGDIMMMMFLVTYLWSAMGIQLFGGELYKENPALKDRGGADLDYFGSKYEVYNFNDMGMSFVTLFFVMVSGWVCPIAEVLAALAPKFTVFWFGACFYSVAFYVVSPLLAFNVFTAFSIDVFCCIQENATKELDEGSKDEVLKNLESIKAEFAATGKVLHVYTDADLERRRVWSAMFLEDDD